MVYISYLAIGLMLAVSIVTDSTRGKIYNWLTIPGFCLGLVYAVLHDISFPFIYSYFILVGILLLLYSHRAIKGGDTKLILAVSLFMSPIQFLLSATIFMLGTFVFFFAKTVGQKGLRATFDSVKADTYAYVATGDIPNNFGAGVKKISIPGGGASFIAFSILISLIITSLIG